MQPPTPKAPGWTVQLQLLHLQLQLELLAPKAYHDTLDIFSPGGVCVLTVHVFVGDCLAWAGSCVVVLASSWPCLSIIPSVLRCSLPETWTGAGHRLHTL